MIILALETSTPTPSAALLEDREVLAEATLPPGQTHSRTLLALVEKLLQDRKTAVRDLGLIVIGQGPGSFTGLRIGLAAAKGLAWAADKPLVGAPSLETIALAVPLTDQPLHPLIDARKGQVYSARFEPDPDRKGWRRVGPVEALTPATLAGQVDRPTLFVGDGAVTLDSTLRQKLGPMYLRAPQGLDSPRASQAGILGLKNYQAGAESDPALILPLYIRPPDIRAPKG